MTNHKAIQSIFTGLRPFTVGFDDMFDHFDNMTNHLPHLTANNYPPYNIVKTGSLTYNIEVALAGYGKKDITVGFEDNILKIESVKSKEEKEVEDNDGVLHQGIAKRSFTKSFNNWSFNVLKLPLIFLCSSLILVRSSILRSFSITLMRPSSLAIVISFLRYSISL